MSLSERDAYIKAMIAKSPTFDDSGDLERVIGEEYDKHSQPLPDGKVWRWSGFLAMFRAGAAWANDTKQAEIDPPSVENDRLLDKAADLEKDKKLLLDQMTFLLVTTMGGHFSKSEYDSLLMDSIKIIEGMTYMPFTNYVHVIQAGSLPCDHVWTSQPWRAGTYQGGPVYEAVCAKCGQTGENP